MSLQMHSYTEPQRQTHHNSPLWTPVVISQSPPFLFTLLAIMAALGFLLGLWLGVSTQRASRPSYPYYDTKKPMPPWSEPAPLKGNHGR